MEPVEPQAEHRWLQKLVGDWTSKMEAQAGPGEECVILRGTETVRSLGGLWTIGEGGEMPGGGESKSIMTLGYDPAKKTFVGSFVASMMTHLWLYDSGELDAAGKVLTLNAEGPNFTQDGMARYQDFIEFVDDDHRLLKSQVQGADGKWTLFMTAHYYRKK